MKYYKKCLPFCYASYGTASHGYPFSRSAFTAAGSSSPAKRSKDSSILRLSILMCPYICMSITEYIDIFSLESFDSKDMLLVYITQPTRTSNYKKLYLNTALGPTHHILCIRVCHMYIYADIFHLTHQPTMWQPPHVLFRNWLRLHRAVHFSFTNRQFFGSATCWALLSCTLLYISVVNARLEGLGFRFGGHAKTPVCRH